MNPIIKALENLPGHWMKGDIADNRGNRCGIGHLYEANGAVVSQNEEFHFANADMTMLIKARILMDQVAAEQYSERVKNSLVTYFADFNDHPDTTEEDVIRVMEKAAVRWDEIV